MIKLASVACAALLTLTACGGGGGSGSSSGSSEDDAAKSSIKTSLTDATGSSSLTGKAALTDEQAGCVADGMVDGIGVSKLQDYGILTKDNKVDEKSQPDNLSAADADTMAKTIVNCVDVGKLLKDQMGDQLSQLTSDQQQCITDTFDDATFEKILSATFQGKTPQVGSDLQGQMMKCMTG